jgi:hypothetical protein
VDSLRDKPLLLNRLSSHTTGIMGKLVNPLESSIGLVSEAITARKIDNAPNVIDSTPDGCRSTYIAQATSLRRSSDDFPTQ